MDRDSLIAAAVIAAAVTVLVALAVWRSARLRRGLRALWRHARNWPALVIAWRRWPALCASCGLGRWKVTTTDGRERRRPVDVPSATRWRLSPAGYELVVKHRMGQSTETFRGEVDVLRSALRGEVRVLPFHDRKGRLRRDRSRVLVLKRDPWQKVARPASVSSTKVRVGVLEDGRDWVLDFERHPHWLVCGETGSGKTGWESALLAGLAPTPAVVVLLDLKWGVSAEAYRCRASRVATTVQDAADVLADLLAIGEGRADLLKSHMVDRVEDLDASVRPVDIFVLVDEVAELAINDGTPAGKTSSTAALRDLTRAVQLLRAMGVHLVIAGQRFGSTIGPQITTIRAQLPGRLCHRVSDRETASMTIGDVAPAAVEAALSIELPGVAAVRGGPDGWQMARSSRVSHQELAAIAARYALGADDRRSDWAGLVKAETWATRQVEGQRAGDGLALVNESKEMN